MTKNRKDRKNLIKTSRIVGIITLIASVAFFIAVMYLGFIPGKYVTMLGVALVGINLLFGLIAFIKSVNSFCKVVQIVLCSILSIAMIIGSIAIPRYKSYLEDMFIGLHDVTELKISVFVRNDSALEGVRDLEDANVAVHDTYDKEHQQEAINAIWRQNFPVYSGFSTYGEQFGRINSNQTLVAVVIGE